MSSFVAVGLEAQLLFDGKILRVRAQLPSRPGKGNRFDRGGERAGALLVVQLDA